MIWSGKHSFQIFFNKNSKEVRESKTWRFRRNVNVRGLANTRTNYEGEGESEVFKNQQGAQCDCRRVRKAGSEGDRPVRVEIGA